jgi:type IX secretion system PorP/SprF family membrane protein
MKNYYALLLFVLGSWSFSSAQQMPLYNQHYVNPYIYNPSYVGFTPGASVTALRNQKWSDYNGGFTTNYFAVGTLLKNKKSGIGLDLYSDYVGLSSKLKAHIAYSHKIKLSDKMALRAGFSAGVIDNRINFSGAIVADHDDPLLNGTAISNGKTSFDVNFGLNYTFSDFHLGIAVPQAVGHQLKYDSAQALFYTLERQYIVNSGYKFFLNREKKISITPDLLAIYSPNLALNYNGSLIFEWEKYGWIAGTYKSNYAVGANVGISLIQNLKIGLAYDFQINEVASHNKSPNFEILLHYTIPQFTKKDTIFQFDTIIKLEPEIKIQEVQNMDSINVLNIRIKQLQDSLKNTPPPPNIKEKPKKASTSTIIKDGVNVKKNVDDHFLELFDKSDSPNGLYVIVGAFGEKNRAEKLLKTSKKEFPNARLIYNERNDLHYVILYYSKNFDKVKAAYTRSRSLKGGRFYKAWILDYQRKK